MEVNGRKIRKQTLDDSTEWFMAYDSLNKFKDGMNLMVKETNDKIPNSSGVESALNSIKNPSTDFQGTSSKEEMERVANGEITTYLYEDNLREFLKEAKQLFSNISLGGSFDKDRMLATDLPIGVFSFALASQGLYRPQEYFSPELGRLIDPDLVINEKVGDEETMFVYKESGSTYTLIQQQEGTNDIRVGKPDAKLVFRTTTKKVNLIRGGKKSLDDKDKGEEKYVDLFVKIGGLSYYTPTMLLYRTLPMIMTAYFLQKANIKCRINAYLESSRYYDDVKSAKFFVSYPIKDYTDNLDVQQIAFESADPRVFRGRDFTYLAAIYYQKLGVEVNSGLGSELTSSSKEAQFERYKNYLIDEAKNSGRRLFNTNKNLMISGGISYSRAERDTEVLKRDAIQEFFRIVDAVDIEFNGLKAAVTRVVTRAVDKKESLSAAVSTIRGSVIDKATTYDYSTSKYSDTDSEIREKIGKRIKLRRSVGEIAEQVAQGLGVKI